MPVPKDVYVLMHFFSVWALIPEAVGKAKKAVSLFGHVVTWKLNKAIQGREKGM